MSFLIRLGRLFYGIAVAAMGFLTIIFRDLPYFMIPPGHSLAPAFVYFLGALLIVAGICVLFSVRTVCFLLGCCFF